MSSPEAPGIGRWRAMIFASAYSIVYFIVVPRQ